VELVDWIHLALDKDQWWDVANIVNNRLSFLGLSDPWWWWWWWWWQRWSSKRRFSTYTWRGW